MSQLLTPLSAPASRASHILPTVKCSNCALPVPLSSLGDHICTPQQQQKPESLQQRPEPPRPQHLQHSQQPRLRSDSQPLPRSRPDAHAPAPSPLSRFPSQNHASHVPFSHPTSHVPFPTVATPPPRQEDYMPGGESGMAGVGRRAFQAAAHAAVFAHHHPNGHPEPIQGMQGRRPNPPQFLDIAGATGRGTPPLSPNSAHSSPRSHSPLSPLSQSPLNTVPVIAASRTPSPSPHTPMSARTYSNSSRSPPPRNTPTPSSSASSRLPFLQRYKDTHGQTPPASPAPQLPKEDPFYTPRVEPIPSPTDSADSESDYSGGGLAYDRDEDEEDEPELELEKAVVSRLSLDKERTSTSSHSAYSSASASKTQFTRDDLPSQSPRRSHTTPTVGPRGGAGGLASPLGSASPPGAGAARSASDAKSLRREKDKESRARARECVRCERKIEDGRWVKTDSNKGVLCETCWKNMYLPKCRRCDKPIEKAAVYSSDGQLKGKYHRDCFTCYTCHQPFPDKSFYVYDGHPMCAFHYHEANRSLCAAPTCGRPIEGPCAITYAGDRYHPDCLRCAHAGCEERLDDYWEVDGVMLCERHAQRVEDEGEDENEDEDDTEEEADDVGELGRIPSLRKPGRLGSSEARAQKRTTRLINLTGTGFGF